MSVCALDIHKCLFLCTLVSAKWINGQDTAIPTARCLGPMFVINVLLSRLAVSEGVIRWDERHSSLLIYWLPFPLV